MAITYRSVLASGGGGAPIDSVEITSPATKTLFNIGESFSIAGLVVSARIGLLEGDVTSECTITPAPGTVLTSEYLGELTVMIDYYGTKVSYDIRVREGIKIIPWPVATYSQLEEMLGAHYRGEINLHGAEGWEIGSERTVSISAIPARAGNLGLEAHNPHDVKMVLMNAGGKTLTTPISGVTECAFIVGMKDNLMGENTNNEIGVIDPTTNPIARAAIWSTALRRKWLNTVFREAITDSEMRSLFKEFDNETYDLNSQQIVTVSDYFSLPSAYEVTGETDGPDPSRLKVAAEGSQFEYYLTPEHRIKYNGSSMETASYWSRSNNIARGSYYYAGINRSGITYEGYYSQLSAISPFGVI